MFQIRTSPLSLFKAISQLSPSHKSCLEQLGFRKLLKFKVNGIPSKIGFYVVDNFDEERMEMTLENASIEITMESIADMIGINNKGVDILDIDIAKDDEMIKNWEDQFSNKKVTPNDVKHMISNSRVADMNFKLSFIVLFTSAMGGVKTKGFCDLSVLEHINMSTDISNINWSNYATNYFRFGRKRPPTTMWTVELLRQRELAEIKSGGLEKGELAGPFVDEEWDPMPKNLEGSIWKLNNYVECIKIERAGFDKTLDTTKLLYPGNTVVSDLEDQYIQLLRNQREDNEKTEGVHTEDSVRTNQRQEPSLEAETQEEVVATSEKVVQEFYIGNSVNNSFVTIASADMEENRGNAGQATLDAIPLNYVSPNKEMIRHGTRVITETDRMKSPFYVRVMNADKDENSDENKLVVYLFSKMTENDSDVLFETKYSQKSSRLQIESLGQQEPVENNVVSSWYAYLNFMEGKKNKYSPARLFFHTFEVDTKVFKCENAQTMEKFLEYVENAHSTYGGRSKLDEADIVLIPVSNNEHKFLLCVNLKNLAVSLIDNKKEVTKVATRAKKKVEDIDDIRVAAILVKNKREKDKIKTKPDKNEKRGEVQKSQEQSQSVEQEKLNKTQKEWPETQTQSKAIQVLKKRRKEKGLSSNSMKVTSEGPLLPGMHRCITQGLLLQRTYMSWRTRSVHTRNYQVTKDCPT
nr:hypothetical protein [Tanacetum cinerariifolium]